MASHQPAPITICCSCYRGRARLGPFCDACWVEIRDRRRELVDEVDLERVDAAIAAIEEQLVYVDAIRRSDD